MHFERIAFLFKKKYINGFTLQNTKLDIKVAVV